MNSTAIPAPAARRPADALRRSAAALRTRPSIDLLALAVLAGTLNLWALARNGFANEYYSGAVRSMSSSWHDFLYASFDPSGVMSVDKPPLALWVQALSVRVFGFHPLSMLVPQALTGVAAVALVYDLTRRRFGRGAGLLAGATLALTPITVAISRHNNPDALLVLCCVGAVWAVVRALGDGRTRWLVLAGVCVGLGFETKMAVALMVVPGIAAAWIWVAPRGRLAALRGLLAGGGAMLLVGGAWPALVALTPAASRPWVSGTSDNSIFSLILGYNGLGRLDGQAGGPQALAGGPGGGAGGPGGGLFGGSAGPLRLLNTSLGGQDGWLLGFAVVALLAILLACRLRRADARTGWLIVVGGAFATSAVAFSFAQGIFHPYYVSLLAPFTAMLVGAGARQLSERGTRFALLAALGVAAAVASELAVLHNEPGQLRWLVPLLLGAGIVLAVVLAVMPAGRVRIAALLAALALLSIAPASWAVQTLGHATSGTFPAGGPAEASGFGGGGMRARRFAGVAPLGARPGFGSPGAGGMPPAGSRPPMGFVPPAGGPPPGAAAAGPEPFGNGAAAGARAQGGFGWVGGGMPAGGGLGAGPFGGEQELTQVLSYVRGHGGGTLAVASQSGAASAVTAGADVAGIGGFSGRESVPSIPWLAAEVRAGRIRWVLTGGGSGPGLARDGRAGSSAAMSAVGRVCRAVSVPALANGSSAGGGGAGSGPSAGVESGRAGASGSGSTGGLYDCSGRAGALLRAQSGS